MRNVSAQGETLLLATPERFFKQSELTIEMEGAISKEGIFPIVYFQLAPSLRGVYIDTECCEALQVVGTPRGINDVKRFIAAFDTILDKRQRYAVLILTAVEEGADMTSFGEVGTCKGNRGTPSHREYLRIDQKRPLG
jgi:hypothetical protein